MPPKLPQLRSLHTSSLRLSPHPPSTDPLYRPTHPLQTPTPDSTLSALLSRLSLNDHESAQHLEMRREALRTCLVDPSYTASKSTRPTTTTSTTTTTTTTTTTKKNGPNNLLLSQLGNHLLGLFTSEHLATTYPNLPTRVLKSAVAGVCGTDACGSVARELGVGLGLGNGVVAVKWERLGSSPNASLDVSSSGSGSSASSSSAAGQTDVQGKGEGSESSISITPAQGKTRTMNSKRKEKHYTEVLANSVRALVGLVYQERGITATRHFVTSHFLSRNLDLPSLLNFRNPKHVLAVEIRRLMADAGVEGGAVVSRILAESGRTSISPVFNIGLFLPSGLKLSEGYGSSLRMAEHRAAINALVAIYTVRGELAAGQVGEGSEQTRMETQMDTRTGRTGETGMDLPTSAHSGPPLRFNGSERGREREGRFRGNVALGRAEAVFGSAGGAGGGGKGGKRRRWA